MKRIVFIYLTLVTLAFGHNYDEVLLKAQASIFPKIILLDKKVEDKLIDGKIVFTIVYDESDFQTALEISDFIDSKYKGFLGKFPYVISLVESSSFSKRTKATAVYILNLEKSVNKIVDIAKEEGVISFSYDIMDLNKGVMFSLILEKSTVLYLKRETLLTKKIDFVDALLQIVKFVDNGDLKNGTMSDNNSTSLRWHNNKDM